MKRSFNYTGRVEVERSSVGFELLEAGMRLTRLDLASYEFPANARVVAEVSGSGSVDVLRAELGEVGSLVLPIEIALHESLLEVGRLTLKVVGAGPAAGRLLGLSGDIAVGRGSEALLPVQAVDYLGEEVWRLTLGSAHGDGRPMLLVNGTIPGILEAVLGPAFRALVHPQVARVVLNEVLLGGEEFDAEAPDWRGAWLRWGRGLHPEHEDPSRLHGDDERDAWIDEVVESFCSRLCCAGQFRAVLSSGSTQ